MSRPERVYLSPPHMGAAERQLLMEAFDSNWIAPLGPHVDGFEKEFARYVGSAHAVAVSSGTAALHLALRMLGVGAGDEVVTSTLTLSPLRMPFGIKMQNQCLSIAIVRLGTLTLNCLKKN